MASRGPLLLGALWVAGAVAATSVGLVAVHLVGNQVDGQVRAPLSDDGVRQALGSVTAPPTPAEEVSTEPSTRPSHEAEDGPVRTVSTVGGIVSARCHDGAPTLLYATPADGYRTERGEATVVFVGSSRTVTTLSCRNGELHSATRTTRVEAPQQTSPAPATPPAPAASPTEPSSPVEPTDGPDQHESGDLPGGDG